MNQTNANTRLRNLMVIAGLAVVVLLLLGCQAQGAADSDAASESVALALEPTAVLPTLTPAAAEETVTPTIEEIDECLTCHIDKDLLIKTADPEEEVINENEGEG
ncbi:MAG TPA: hypothetical protein EYH05_21590 [Anaerolineae bacterium]|nr:hypothetical protein [Anaerolineae bacterium]